ncbi:MAG TPA: hypothetical protein VK879_13325, partial [Candidatus Sulfomarinibacteraceae bacterium]|nr:hypothetical protein [Candidatus Sulfomarinibacteraceae bacterium]
MFDVADRGLLRIEEIRSAKRFRDRDFAVELVQEPAGLQPHERGLLALLFEAKHGRAEKVKFSELSKRVTSRQWKKYAGPLSEELEEAGFISEKRATACAPPAVVQAGPVRDCGLRA